MDYAKPQTKIVGELIYVYSPEAFVWRAQVERAVKGFALYIDGGALTARVNAGMFDTVDGVISWARRAGAAAAVRAGIKDVKSAVAVDTLSQIQWNASTGLVVPGCYVQARVEAPSPNGRGLAECPKCAYRTACAERAPEAASQPQFTKFEEREEDFIARLRAKTQGMKR